jgi:predicted nucleic acid-binding protein
MFVHLSHVVSRKTNKPAVLLKELFTSVCGYTLPISHNDVLIAGHCLSIDAILVTDNVREFKRVDGLKFENWVDR